MAFSDQYNPGSRHRFTTVSSRGETKHYVVAMLPLIRRVADPRRAGKETVHVTICFAKAEDYPRFRPVDELTLNEIRGAIMCMDQNSN